MMSAILFLMPILLFCGVQSKPNSKWLLVETEPVYNKESRQDHKEPSKPNGTHIDYVDGVMTTQDQEYRCSTGSGRACVFPFIYNGIGHSSCLPRNKEQEGYWCAITVNKMGQM